MGQDITIWVNNSEEVFHIEYDDEQNDFFHKHNLSRTFCNFMCRGNVISHEPELDQIGRITGVDITPIYEMEQYPEEEGQAFFLSVAESEAEKQKIIADAERKKLEMQGNIDKVLKTIDSLISKLTAIDNLPALLEPTDFDTLGNEEYFAHFTTDTGDGYIGNNFGQDLRNFKRFLEYAKAKSTTTVWFTYG